MGLRFGDNYASCSCQDSKPCNFNLAALMGVPSFTTKDRTLLDQVLGLERMRAEYIPDDIMLSVLVRALPKAIQPHVQLQLNETSTYDQVRAMLVSYDALQLHGPQARFTQSWAFCPKVKTLPLFPLSHVPYDCVITGFGIISNNL